MEFPNIPEIKIYAVIEEELLFKYLDYEKRMSVNKQLFPTCALIFLQSS